MTTPAIHIHTSVDKTTVRYARFMWETALAMATRPDLLRLTVHSMGPVAAETLRDLTQSTMSQVMGHADQLHGSYGHGACIMAALGTIVDSDIHVIADSDTVIIAKGWDDYLRQRMGSDGIGMMGTTYEDLGGFSSGSDRVQTYKKVPTFTWVALSPRFGWPALNVMPNKDHIIHISDERLSKTYGLPVGYSVFGEAGWQLPQFVTDNDIPYDGWRQLKPTKDAIVLKGLSDYHEEFHADGVPFVVHHRGSMKHTYRGDRISTGFYNAVDSYLIEETKRAARWAWQDEKFSFNIPTRVAVHVDPVPADGVLTPINPGSEWLKVSHDGVVIRPRSALGRTANSEPVTISFGSGVPLGHLRVEGVLVGGLRLIVPGGNKPYTITCRNATACSLFVCTLSGVNSVEVHPNQVTIILVDVDGTFRVT